MEKSEEISSFEILDVFYWGLKELQGGLARDNFIAIWFKKRILQFSSSKSWIRIHIDLRCCIPYGSALKPTRIHNTGVDLTGVRYRTSVISSIRITHLFLLAMPNAAVGNQEPVWRGNEPALSSIWKYKKILSGLEFGQKTLVPYHDPLEANADHKNYSSLHCIRIYFDNSGRKLILFTEHADYAVLAHTCNGTSEPMLLGRPVCTVNKFSFLTMLESENIATLNF